jgi:hypothetical protein
LKILLGGFASYRREFLRTYVKVGDGKYLPLTEQSHSVKLFSLLNAIAMMRQAWMNWVAPILANRAVLVGRLEKVLARLSPLASLYSRPYLRVVEQEIRLASIGRADIVVNIGCGAVPFTAIHLARLTGARVIAMDRDNEAVECARRYLKASGLQETIEVVCGDGEQAAECEGARVWVVALQAAPKEGILKHFLNNAPRGTRAVFREPRTEFSNQYDQLPCSARPQSVINYNMITFNRSVLFTREA